MIESSGHGNVTIGAVEKYITDNAWDQGWIKPIKPSQKRGQSIGIIGGGPGGLAAAEKLVRKAYKVNQHWEGCPTLPFETPNNTTLLGGQCLITHSTVMKP